jgi:hypothetical protein
MKDEQNMVTFLFYHTKDQWRTQGKNEVWL